jgi:hypothetical protein
MASNLVTQQNLLPVTFTVSTSEVMHLVFEVCVTSSLSLNRAVLSALPTDNLVHFMKPTTLYFNTAFHPERPS